MEKLFNCGAWCLDLLGSLGFCQDRLQIHSSVGGTGLESTPLEFEPCSVVPNVVYLEGAKLAYF